MKKNLFILLILTLMIQSCENKSECVQPKDWETTLTEKLPYLGHRNWVVITDMAYPLQSGDGITTLFANESYEVVLEKVKKSIDDAPHVFAHVYNDKELGFIPDSDVPGISMLRGKMQEICGKEVMSLPHEELISRLDAAGKLFHVVIIKTPLTMPYTSTFFELDCNYWDAERQQRLDESLKQQQ